MRFNPFAATPKGVLLTLAVLLYSTGGAFAQKESVRLSRSQMTGAEIFEEIEAQTPVTIGYDKTVFDSGLQFTISKTQNTVEGILDEMFANSPVVYKFQDKIAFLSPRLSPLVKANSAARPARTNDVYVYQPEGSVSAARNPRPEAVKPEPVAEQVEIVTPREFPQVTLEYKPLESYMQSYKSHPTIAIKTNLLYAAAALTTNLAAEVRIAPRSTLTFSGSYNWYGREKDSKEDTKQFVHSIFSVGYRYWFCESFNGLFIGANAFYARYNVGDIKVPMLFDKEYRYDGNAWGGAVSVGYHWAFAKHWGIEVTAGAAHANMKYDRFDCNVCDRNAVKKTKNYFGPANLGINLVFLIK